MQRVRELDGLRAIAILLVLGCHYEAFSGLAWGLPRFGWIGVDLFFCLSGYLITTILLSLRGRSTPYKNFYARRLIRILPPYLAVMAFITVWALKDHWFDRTWLIMQVFFLQAYSHNQRLSVIDTLTHVRWYVHHLSSLRLYAHQLPLAQAGASLQVKATPSIFWSLSVEEYFYLLWAPVVLRLSRSLILATGIAVCAIEMFLRWSLASQSAYFGLAYRFDGMIYGAFLALLFSYWKKVGFPAWSRSLLSGVLLLTTVGLGSILFALHPVVARDPRYSPLFLVFGMPLLSAGCAALIGLLVLRAESEWWLSRLLRQRTLQFIGAISYTMYLVHLLAAAAVRRMNHVAGLQRQTLTQAVFATILTVVIAQASWLVIESPFLRWKDRRFPNVSHSPPPAIPALRQRMNL